MQKVISNERRKSGSCREVVIKIRSESVNIYENITTYSKANGYENNFSTITLNNNEILEIAELIKDK